LIVSPPLSQSVYCPQQVQPVYVIHPKPWTATPNLTNW
jgi:hypothetical protein